MTDKILALFVAGLIHFWNPTGSPQDITVKIADNPAVMLHLAPLSETVAPFTGRNQIMAITASSDVRTWFTAQEVPFEAQKPAVRWEVPVHKGTGIVLANPNSNPVTITLSIAGIYTDGQLSENTSFGLFVSDIFGSVVDGTLVITASSALPITVTASQCNVTCQPVATN